MSLSLLDQPEVSEEVSSPPFCTERKLMLREGIIGHMAGPMCHWWNEILDPCLSMPCFLLIILNYVCLSEEKIMINR